MRADGPEAVSRGRGGRRPTAASARSVYNTPMTDHTYSITEIVGTSPDGIDQAIRNGIARADKTLRNLDWFEVAEVRGYVSGGAIDHFQVRLKIGFRLEEEGPGT
jgi:flavin-binding protein dodecin